MEKYAVEIDQNLTKNASEKATCPKCGEVLTYKGNIPYCIDCGTEPFEKKR